MKMTSFLFNFYRYFFLKMKTDYSNFMTKLGLYTKSSMTCHAELACLNIRLVSQSLSNFENRIILYNNKGSKNFKD